MALFRGWYPKDPATMTADDIRKWLRERQKCSLYVDSDEYEGMSLSYVNPALVQDTPTAASKNGKP